MKLIYTLLATVVAIVSVNTLAAAGPPPPKPRAGGPGLLVVQKNGPTRHTSGGEISSVVFCDTGETPTGGGIGTAEGGTVTDDSTFSENQADGSTAHGWIVTIRAAGEADVSATVLCTPGRLEERD